MKLVRRAIVLVASGVAASDEIVTPVPVHEADKPRSQQCLLQGYRATGRATVQSDSEDEPGKPEVQSRIEAREFLDAYEASLLEEMGAAGGVGAASVTTAHTDGAAAVASPAAAEKGADKNTTNASTGGGKATESMPKEDKEVAAEKKAIQEAINKTMQKAQDEMKKKIQKLKDETNKLETDALNNATEKAVEALKNNTGGHGVWNYQNTSLWPETSQDCLGNDQSPIDIEMARLSMESVAVPGQLVSRFKYKTVTKENMKVSNTGHALKVEATGEGGFGTFELPDGMYEAKQFHFHFPSEHALDHMLASGEMQIVHQRINATGTDAIAVVGILLEDSKFVASDMFDEFGMGLKKEMKFFKDLQLDAELPAPGNELTLNGNFSLNLAHVFADSLAGSYFHYRGSLTTPPCSETVHWYVMQRPAAVSSEIVENFHKTFAPTNRIIQSTNGRTLVQNEVLTSNYEFGPEPVVGVIQLVSPATVEATGH